MGFAVATASRTGSIGKGKAMARYCWLFLLLLSSLTIATSAYAEVGDRTPGQLQEMAASVITGTVQRIYETTETSDGFEVQRWVAEISVQSVEKGDETASLVYARYWSKRWVGGGPPPTTGYGHRGVPSRGEAVRVFLAKASDGGLDVVYPNGFQATGR